MEQSCRSMRVVHDAYYISISLKLSLKLLMGDRRQGSSPNPKLSHNAIPSCQQSHLGFTTFLVILRCVAFRTQFVRAHSVLWRPVAALVGRGSSEPA
jgi:hypothetical protein